MSRDVRSAMGSELAAEVEQMDITGARCAVCQRLIPAQGPATVLAARDSDRARAVFAHPSCSPSVLLDVPAVPGPAADAEEMMWLTPFVASQGATIIPALVAEMASKVFRVPRPGEGGDAVNLVVAVLLAKGFTLVSRLRQPLRQLPGWTATVTGDCDDAQMTITAETENLF